MTTRQFVQVDCHHWNRRIVGQRSLAATGTSSAVRSGAETITASSTSTDRLTDAVCHGGTEVEPSSSLPTDDFRESISQSTCERGRHYGSRARVYDARDEKSQGNRRRFVTLLTHCLCEKISLLWCVTLYSSFRLSWYWAFTWHWLSLLLHRWPNTFSSDLQDTGRSTANSSTTSLPPPMKLRRYCDTRRLAVRLFVCLLVNMISQKLLTDLNQIMWKDRSSTKDQLIRFWIDLDLDPIWIFPLFQHGEIGRFRR